MRRRNSGWIALLLVLAVSGIATASINMEFTDADVRDVLQILGEMGRVNVVIDDEVTGLVSLQLKDVDVDSAIDLVVKVTGFSTRWVGNTLVVAREDRLRDRFPDDMTRFFPLQYADPAALVAPLRMVTEAAEVMADVVHGGIIVRGSPKQLNLAQSFLRERDVQPTLEFDFADENVLRIFRELAKKGGYTLIADSDVDSRLTFYYRGRDVDEALRLVGEQSGIAYTIDGNKLVLRTRAMDAGTRAPGGFITTDRGHDPTIGVGDSDGARNGLPTTPPGDRGTSGTGDLLASNDTRPTQPTDPSAVDATTTAPTTVPAETKPPEPVEVRVFRFEHIKADQLRQALTVVVPESDVHIDAAMSTVVASGTAAQLEAVAQLLKEYDVPRFTVRGVMSQQGQKLAILQVDDATFVVGEGERVGRFVVDIIASDGIVLLDEAGDRRWSIGWKVNNP